MKRTVTIWALAATVYSVYLTDQNIRLNQELVKTEFDKSRDTVRFCTLQDSTLDVIVRLNKPPKHGETKGRD